MKRSKIHTIFCLCAGLLAPGLGQFLRKRVLTGLLVFSSVTTPLVWVCFLLNQRVYSHILRAQGEAMPLVLNGTFLRYLGEANVLQPIHIALVAFAVAVHLSAAIRAGKATLNAESHPSPTG